MSEVVAAPAAHEPVVVSGYIPVIDFSGATSADPAVRQAVGDALDEACRTSGFFTVVGHGVDRQAMEHAIAKIREFFELPVEVKRTYLAEKGDPTLRGLRVWHDLEKGYDLAAVELAAIDEALGGETAAGERTSVGETGPAAASRRPDVCELFTINRLGEPGVAEGAGLGDALGVWSKPNVWPAEVPGLREAWLTLYAELKKFAVTIMRMFALGLGLPENYFDGLVDEHVTNLCANYYPAILGEVGPDQFRKMPHTDSGTVTILYQDTQGLQVVNRATGEWVDVPYVPGSYVVNIGDMMAIWTNDRWVSTRHRCLIPPPEQRRTPRISMPFFHQPNWDALIECLPTCHGPDNPPRHPPVRSGDYLEYKIAPLVA